jgi:hypothetical protein
MHAHGLSSVTSFMARYVDNSTVCAYYPYFKTRFSLILSKTLKLEVDLASVNMEVIDLYEAARGKHSLCILSLL